MHNYIQDSILIVVIAPLLGCLIAGVLGKQVGRRGAQNAAIAGVAISFIFSLFIAKLLFIDGAQALNFNLYTWSISGHYQFHIGFLIDRLSACMLLIVTFVSLLVHIYTIGYMSDDPGYQRFFSYIALFTFSMLMLVSANNFLQLFFGWEAVGLVSYLLIGFWFQRERATEGSLKAFLVNRVGDFGFLLGIAAILAYFGSLDYATVFKHLNVLQGAHITLFSGHSWSVATVICILLFIGAMGKSAQIPLHVWLPESMEGPTPISALIHAATMVTAGIFMVARMSPLYELSQPALSFILIIGASGALFLGLVGIVQNDIKRVVAYSTLSQLGYMMAAMGASAFAAGMFHLFTHACFKALLFLGAGSVIIGMHHEQDMRKMGGLGRYMPITYITMLIGSLALCGIPPFAGFYSKDAVIEAVGLSHIFGHSYAHICLVLGALVTALYTFRMFFMTFHGKPRMDEHTRSHLHESPWVVWLPLVLLAIPSMIMGYLLIDKMLFAQKGIFGQTIYVSSHLNVLMELGKDFHGALAMMWHAPMTVPFWLAILGIIITFICYIINPVIPEKLAASFKWFYEVLINKFGFDILYQWLFVRGSRKLGEELYKDGDQLIIDNGLVNNSGRFVGLCSRCLRQLQTGFLYSYAFTMVIGLVVLLAWMIFK